MCHASRRLAAFTLLAPLLLPAVAFGWPAGNALVASDHLDRTRPASISDGVGGAIIVWEEEYRGATNIFAQHLDAAGAPLWGQGGIVVCSATGSEHFPAISSDGSGGALIAWQDYRAAATSNIYAQRIASNGSISWAQNGVAVCTAINNEFFPVIAPDGSGGAIVAWWDGRGADFDIYARRINSSGTPQWTADGVALCTFTGNQTAAAIVTDGSGGAIVAWSDVRGANSDIYAQRISSAGAVQWAGNGVALCAATGNQTAPSLAIDGSGGALVAWTDLRSGVDEDIYARRITSAGAPQGAANGVAVCTMSGDQDAQRLEPDGVGGAFVVWQDARGADADIYAQRVDGFIFSAWTANGVGVCATSGSQSGPRIARDVAGGVLVSWVDYRGADGPDVYGQRMNASGASQWPANGVPACVAIDDQIAPGMVSDNTGGAIIVWQDRRNGSLDDLYAQRIDAGGSALWTGTGVLVAPKSIVDQQFLTSVSDGAGGMILTWEETYAGLNDLYAQRIDGTGSALWGIDGVAVSTAANQQGPAWAVADGAGGAVIAWPDYRVDGSNAQIYAQRISAAGVAQWTTNGVAICTASGGRSGLVVTTDGAGGAIMAWHDMRPSGDGDIYVQRVSSAGVPQWAANGVALCLTTGLQNNPSITSDGAAGAIVAWQDQRGVSPDIYVRRVSSAGVPQWTSNGVALCTDASQQQGPQITSDGVSGAIVAWQDRRSGTRGDVYARRVTSAGVAQWTANGVAVCTAAGEKYSIEIVPDGASGAILGWIDTRASAFWDIYAQRLNGTGVTQWTADGVPVSIATGNQALGGVVSDGAAGAYFAWADDRAGSNDVYVQRVSSTGEPQFAGDGTIVSGQQNLQQFVNVVTDGAGGAIVAWQDYRVGPDADLYANRVLQTGPVSVPVGLLRRDDMWLGAAPNPARGALEFRFGNPRRERVTLALYDAQGRRVRVLLDTEVPAGMHALAWDGRDDAGRMVPSAVYFCRLECNGLRRVTPVAMLR